MTSVEQMTKLVTMNWIKSKLSTKQKQYSNKRQTSIEVKVGKLLSVFFISIFAGQLQQRFESHGNRYLVLLNSRHLKTP